MKLHQIAVAVATLALAGAARASTEVDLTTAQQRAEEGAAPSGEDTRIDNVASTPRVSSHLLGEAQEQAETGEGYVAVAGASSSTDAPSAPKLSPWLGEAQQEAETGRSL